MFIVKKKETVEVVKETFTVTISKKRFNEQKDDIKKFMEETLDETELNIVDIIHKNDKIKIVAEKFQKYSYKFVRMVTNIFYFYINRKVYIL